MKTNKDIEFLDIEDFIENFRTKKGEFNEDTSGDIIRLFVDGYCYHFAKILENAYPYGKVCKTWPMNHFVYKYNNKYYDIEGEYVPNEHGCIALIPFEMPYFIDKTYMKHVELDYLHNVDYDKTEPSTINTYTVNDVQLNKMDLSALIYLLYLMNNELLEDDESTFNIIKSTNKWFDEERYKTLKDIARETLLRLDDYYVF